MVLYGRTPRQLGISAIEPTNVPELDDWLKIRADMNNVIQNLLHRACQRMKAQADKGRMEREFAIGDKVYLKLQPYVQMTVARRTNQKLSFKYFGPFEILQRVGAVDYKLKLPATSKIHLVVHVSILKKAVAPDTQVCSNLPDICWGQDNAVTPEAILQTRLLKMANGTHSQVLVKWTGMPPHMSTWESLSDMQEQFLDALAWGQASSQGEGHVTILGPSTKKAKEPEATQALRRSLRARKPKTKD